MDNVQTLSPLAGDIVREKTEDLDYVIYAAAALSGGGLALRAISLYDNSQREWIAETYDSVNLQVLKKNAKGLDPETILENMNAEYQRVSKVSRLASAADFEKRLRGPQGKFIRDMLLIGDSIEEFDKRTLDLARSLVENSGKVWTEADVFHTLANAIPEEEFDADFIRQFSKEFHSRMQTIPGKRNPVANSNLIRTDLADILLPRPDGSFEDTNLRILDRLLSRSKEVGTLQGKHQGFLTRLLSPDVTDDIILDSIGGTRGSGQGRKNLSKLINKVMVGMGGRDAPEVYEYFLSGLLTRTINALENGGIDMPLFMENMSKSKEFGEIFERAMDAEKSQKNSYRNKNARRSQRNRINKSIRLSDKILSVQQLEEMIRANTKDTRQYLSMSSTELFENYIGQMGKVSLGGRMYSMSDSADRIKLANQIGKHHMFMMNADELRNMLVRAQNGQEIVLDRAVKQNQRLRETLQGDTISRIAALHSTNDMLSHRSNTIVHFRVSNDIVERRAQEDMLLNVSLLKEHGTSLPPVEDGYTRIYIAQSGGKLDAVLAEDIGKLADMATGQKTEYYYRDIAGEIPSSDKLWDEVIYGQPIFDMDQTRAALQQGKTLNTLHDYINNKIAIAKRPYVEQVIGGVKGNTEAAFRAGYQANRLAFVSIKGAPERGLRMVGTSISSPNGIQDQIDRAYMLLNPDNSMGDLSDIAFLDFETDIETGRLEEVSIASPQDLHDLNEKTSSMSRGEMLTKQEARKALKGIEGSNSLFNKRYRNLSPKARKREVVRILADLKSRRVVVAQSANDWEFLRTEVRELKELGVMTQLEADNFIGEITNIEVNKGLTSEIIPMLTGHTDLGNASQARMTAQYLNIRQTHTALWDNLDNYNMLTGVFRDDFNKIHSQLQIMDFSSGEALGVTVNNPRFSQLNGQRNYITGCRQLTDGEIQLQIVNQNNVRMPLSGSPGQIATMLGVEFDKVEKVQNFERHIATKLSDDLEAIKKRAVVERADRMIRDLNPFNKTVSYPYQTYSTGTSNMDRTLQVLRVRYLGDPIMNDFRESLGSVLDLDQIDELAHKTVPLEDDFHEVLQRAGIDHSMMSQDEIRGLRESVVEEITMRATDAQYDEAVQEMITQLGDGGEKIFRLAMQKDQHGKVQALIAGLMSRAEKVAEQSDRFTYTLSAGLDNTLRASKAIVDPHKVLLSEAMMGFQSELFFYAVNHGDTEAGRRAQELLKNAGMEDYLIDDVDYDLIKNNTEEFFKNTSQIPNMGTELGSLRPTFARFSNQFTRNSPDLVNIMLQSFEDRVAQLTGGDQAVLQQFTEGLRTELIDMQANYRGSGSLADAMMAKVEDQVSAFLGVDPEARLNILKQEYTKYDILTQLSDETNVNKVLGQIESITETDVQALKHIEDIFNMEDTDAAVEKLKDLLDGRPVLNEPPIATNELNPDPTDLSGGGPKETEMLAEAVNDSKRAVPAEDIVETTAKAARKHTIPTNLNVKPLMALAGATALLGAFRPDLEKNYSAGNQSDRLRSVNAFNSVSEVPGSQRGMAVYTGQEDPFRLEISINAFVMDKQTREDIVRGVYDSISQELEFRKVDENHRDEPTYTSTRAQLRDSFR